MDAHECKSCGIPLTNRSYACAQKKEILNVLKLHLAIFVLRGTLFIQNADYLTPQQKRDILHSNAARFLGTSFGFTTPFGEK
jgi:hypothetical protein